MLHTRRTCLTARWFCLALALAWHAPAHVLCSPKPPPQTQQQPSPTPPTKYIRGHDFDTRHIKLDLRFDWQNERVSGTASITLSPLLAGLSRIELDAANMTFSSVRLDSGKPLKFQTDAPQERLRVELDRAYQPSDVLTILLDYQTDGVAANPAGGAPRRGVTFVKPTPDDPNKPRQIWSQGQPEYSHHWFPCHDHPNDFATTEVTATTEKPAVVISNGRLSETTDNRDGTRTFHWKMEQPHAVYLTSIVVGEFAAIETSYDGIPVVTYVHPDDLAAGRSSAARLGEMVKFFSEKTGVRYPYPKYAQTFVRDYAHIEGMENISASTVTDLILQDARAELDLSSEGLQVHEVAHQWFGNYVTPRTWADIWLSEGFAVYMQALWDEHTLGGDDLLNRVRRNQNIYHAALADGSRHPLVNRNYASPDDTLDLNAYRGGAVVLHMLRTTLGEENWWRAVRHYLSKYANQPVETEQFRIAIEEATGQPLDWFFDQWVYGLGFPILRVTQKYDASARTLTLTVRQEQRPDPSAGFPQPGLFRAALDVGIGTAGGTRVERVMLEPREEQSFTFAADSPPLLVNFDRGGAIFKQLEFDKSLEELIYQLAHDQDVAGRFWAFGQLSRLSKAAATSEADGRRIVAAYGETLSKDRFWGLRVDAAAALAGAAGSGARAALLAATKDKDARVRSSATAALRASKDPTLAGLYRQLLNDRSYATVRTAALALAETRSPMSFDSLVKLLDVASWRDTLSISGLNGLELLGDRRALEIGMRFASGNHPIRLRASALALTAAVGKEDPRAFALLSNELLRAVTVNNTALADAAARALAALGDHKGLDVFTQAKASANNPQMKSLLMQSEELLRQKLQPAQQKTSGS